MAMTASRQHQHQHQQRRETPAEREKRALKKKRKQSRKQQSFGLQLQREASSKPAPGCAAAESRETKRPQRRFGPQRIEQVKDGLPLPGTGLQLCRSGHLDALRTRVENGSWHPATTDRYGSTALMWAAGSGHVAVAAWLVEEHCAEVEARNKDGRSALMWAVRNAELKMCDWLVDRHGAALDAVRNSRSSYRVLDPLCALISINRFCCAGEQIWDKSSALGDLVWFY